MNEESTITVECVHGGFILIDNVTGEPKTQVFESHGKLMKALRAAVNEGSLLSRKDKDDEEQP